MGNWLNLTGLLYDITGAYFLVRAVVFNSKEKIAQQVATAWNYNKHLIPAVVEQRLEGVLGLMLLVLGFILQGLSDFWGGEREELLFGLGLLAAILLTYRLSSRLLIRIGTERVIEFIEEKKQKAQGEGKSKNNPA